MVENQSIRGVDAAEPICWKIKSLRVVGNMVENQSLRRVDAAEPIWWKSNALERWAQRSQYVGK